MLKIYRSTDDKAPELAHQEGGFRTVLKACLVTGYGQKQPAGWTLAEDDSAKASTFIPQDVSTGCRYTIDQEDADFARITAQTREGDAFATGFLNKKLWNMTEPNRWLCLADGKRCWLLVQTDASGYQYGAVYYFGDVATLDAAGEAGALFTPTAKEYTEGQNRPFNNMPLQLSTGVSCLADGCDFGNRTGQSEQAVLLQTWFYRTDTQAVCGLMPEWYTAPNALGFTDTAFASEQAIPQLGSRAKAIMLHAPWFTKHWFVLLGEDA